MKIAILTYGIPNNNSSQNNADPLIFCNFLKKLGHEVTIFSILNLSTFSSDRSNYYYYKNFYKNYGVKIKLLDYDDTKIYKKILKLFFLNPFALVNKKKLNYLISNLEKFNPDILINFSTRCASLVLNYKSKFKVNYLQIDENLSTKARLKNQKKLLNYFKYIALYLYSKIYLFKYNFIKKKIFNQAELNFQPCPDSYQQQKKISENFFISRPLSQSKKKNFQLFKKKNKKIRLNIFMIGNLKSTFMVNSILNLLELSEELNELQKKYLFNIDIVGRQHNSDLDIIKKKLKKFKWIKFKGWVPDVNKYYQNYDFLINLEKTNLSVRTKILDAMSCGLPVITYKESNFFNSKFINNHNILLSNNHVDFIKNFKKMLSDTNLRRKLSRNSHLTWKKYYDVNNIMKLNVDKITANYVNKKRSIAIIAPSMPVDKGKAENTIFSYISKYYLEKNATVDYFFLENELNKKVNRLKINSFLKNKNFKLSFIKLNKINRFYNILNTIDKSKKYSYKNLDLDHYYSNAIAFDHQSINIVNNIRANNKIFILCDPPGERLFYDTELSSKNNLLISIFRKLYAYLCYKFERRYWATKLRDFKGNICIFGDYTASEYSKVFKKKIFSVKPVMGMTKAYNKNSDKKKVKIIFGGSLGGTAAKNSIKFFDELSRNLNEDFIFELVGHELKKTLGEIDLKINKKIVCHKPQRKFEEFLSQKNIFILPTNYHVGVRTRLCSALAAGNYCLITREVALNMPELKNCASVKILDLKISEFKNEIEKYKYLSKVRKRYLIKSSKNFFSKYYSYKNTEKYFSYSNHL